MLSRVADALYWIGRYVERAENTTRLLLVTEDPATELRGFDEKQAAAAWGDVLAIFPGVEVGGAAGGDRLAREHLGAFFANPMNAYSILYSVRKARENARAIREALTLEVFVTVNDAFRRLDDHRRREIRDVPGLRSALSETHRDLLGIAGAVEQTLTRDQGFHFLKLGEAVERVYRAAIVLGVKLRSLGAVPADLPPTLFYTQWGSLLRALSSLENYRKAWGARMEPTLVTQFLLFDAQTPRSLRYGTGAIKRFLDEIPGPIDTTPLGRLVGRVAARLEYEDERAAGDPLTLVDEVALDVARIHDAIELHYFGT